MSKHFFTIIFFLIFSFSVFTGVALYMQYEKIVMEYKGGYTQNVYAMEYHTVLQNQKEKLVLNKQEKNIADRDKKVWKHIAMKDIYLDFFVPNQYQVYIDFDQRVSIVQKDELLEFSFPTMDMQVLDISLEEFKKEIFISNESIVVEELISPFDLRLQMNFEDNVKKYFTYIQNEEIVYQFEHIGPLAWDFIDALLEQIEFNRLVT
jgi:hypothetical protein